MCSNFFGILFSPPYLVAGCMVKAGATVSGGTALILFRAPVSAGLCGAERPDILLDGEWLVVGEAFVD